jgi:hypothetical protein
MVRRATARGKFGREDKSAQMYSAFSWRLVGPGTLVGPSQAAKFDGGVFKIPGQSAITVPLGEARTDVDGHLLVLGGFGTSRSSPNGPLNSGFLDNNN